MFTLYAALVSFLFYSCASHKNNNAAHENYYKQVYKQSDDTPYPSENFLFMKRVIEDRTNSENKEYTVSSASGIAIQRDKKTVYGLTAAHWCQDIKDPEFEKYVTQIFGYETIDEAYLGMSNQVDFYGKTYYMDIIAIDLESDLCLIKFKSDHARKINKIKIAKDQPRIGEKIYTSSAPQGIANHNIRLNFEGMYSGCAAPGECFYTIPGVIGSSGSGILNASGELVGMLNFSIIGFHNVTGGPSTQQIREFVFINLGSL